MRNFNKKIPKNILIGSQNIFKLLLFLWIHFTGSSLIFIFLALRNKIISKSWLKPKVFSLENINYPILFLYNLYPHCVSFIFIFNIVKIKNLIIPPTMFLFFFFLQLIFYVFSIQNKQNIIPKRIYEISLHPYISQISSSGHYWY